MEIVEEIEKIVGRRVEHPEREEWGDYAVFMKPGPEADEVMAKLEKVEFVEKVERVGGFVNIRLKMGYLVGQMTKVTMFKEYKSVKRRICFEYGQPNTHKLPHIGHLFSYIYGEAMCRILEAVGNEVRRVNYQGDVGLHVAKCLWAYLKEKPEMSKDLEGKVKLLQLMYQKGSAAYEQDKAAKREIGELNKKIYAGELPEWEETRGWSVDYYKQFEARIGAKYDQYYFESQVAGEGKDVVEKNVGSVFEKSEGAIVYKKGPHTRVFVTGEGNPTYEAKDLALELTKMRDWPCDLLVITTAAEQNEYFKVVFAALEEMEPKLVGKLKHVGFGMINLKSGKMASRTGNIIGGVELVDIVVGEVKSEAVGVGAVKYAFLKKGAVQDMEFDIQSSIAIEGNSGPYLQYTYARCASVLRKSNSPLTPLLNQERGTPQQGVSYNPEELAVLRYIYRFGEVVEEAAERFAPNLVCNFLYELASRFNSFYNKHTILGSEFRLAMTRAVGEVLKSGLNLLGIEVLERM